MAKPTADRYAARRPPQPIRRAANSSNELPPSKRARRRSWGPAATMAWTFGSLASARASAARDARDQTDCQEDPANDNRDLVHAIENLQRWQTGVKKPRCFALISLNSKT